MSKRRKKVKKKDSLDNRKFAFYNTYQFVSLIKNFQSAREGENRRKI